MEEAALAGCLFLLAASCVGGGVCSREQILHCYDFN
jgi:hypothetical protein